MKKSIIVIACVIFGPVLVWRGGGELMNGFNSKSWPTVQGTVRSSGVTESRSRKGVSTYTPVVEYDYEVAGDVFKGDRVDSGSRDVWSLGDAMEIAGRYPEGEEVLVHYDPKSPGTALLETGVKGVNWVLVAVGLLMTGGGLFSAYSVWRRFQNDEFMRPTGGF